MRHTLLHIYGPLAIHSFGVMIALGILVFTWFVLRHPSRATIISEETFFDSLLVGISTAILGGRLLYALSEWRSVAEWQTFFTLWEGGFSILGSVLATLTLLPWYLKRHAVPILPCIDLVALYAPLLQAISRVGCFLAGCCYGTATTLPWGIMYTDRESIAPLGTPLHPTQLYSALLLFSIFLFIYCIYPSLRRQPGLVTCSYLFFISIERFIVDFYRGDHASSAHALWGLSINQWIALILCITTFCIFVYSCNHRRTPAQTS